MKELPLIQPSLPRVLSLEEETRYAEHGIVSRTLLNLPNARMILFGFAEGQELTEHTTTQHAVVQILSGECEFNLGGTWHSLSAGAMVHLPPNLVHALKATKAFSMLLTMIKPG